MTDPVSLQTRCIELFKRYLLDDNAENLAALTKVFNKLSENNRVLFEGIYRKDPLFRLMNGELENFDAASRRYMLNDYFEGEWSEKEFKP